MNKNKDEEFVKIYYPDAFLHKYLENMSRCYLFGIFLNKDVKEPVVYSANYEPERLWDWLKLLIEEYIDNGIIKELKMDKEMNLKTSEQWSKIIEPEIIVMDPDGWDRKNYDYSWKVELITQEEYIRRKSESTCVHIDYFK